MRTALPVYDSDNIGEMWNKKDDLLYIFYIYLAFLSRCTEGYQHETHVYMTKGLFTFKSINYPCKTDQTMPLIDMGKTNGNMNVS